MTIIGEAFVNILPESEGFIDDLGSKLGGIVEGLGGPVAAIGASVVAVGIGLAALGEKYENVFHNIQIATGAVGTQLEGLDTSFKTVLGNTAGSFDQVQTAIDKIYQKTGLTGAALDDFAQKEVNLGIITKTDVGANVDATTSLFNKFGIAAGNQSAQLDVLFKASQASGVGVADLAGQLTTAGGPLQAFGYSLDQSAALFATFDKAGINSSQVTTALNKAFVTLTKEGLDPQQAKAKLDALFQSLAAGKNPTKDSADALALFGSKSGLALTQAAQSGKLNVDALFKDITDGKGGIDKTTDATLSLTQRMEELKNKLYNELEPVASRVLEDITKGVDYLLAELQKPGFKAFEKQVEAIATAFEEHLLKSLRSKDFKDFETEVGTLFTRLSKDLMPILKDPRWETFATDVEAIGKAFAIKDLTDGLKDFGDGLNFIDQHKDVLAAVAIGITTALIPALFELTLAQIGLAAAELGEAAAAAAAWIATFGPVILVGAAIAGLALLIIDNFGTIKNAFHNFETDIEALGAVFKLGVDTIIGFISAIPSDIQAIFAVEEQNWENIGHDIINGIVHGLTSAGSAVSGALKNIATGALSDFKNALQINSPSLVFADAASSIPEGIAKGVNDNASTAHNALSNLYDGLNSSATARFGAFAPTVAPGAAGGSNVGLHISIAAPGATPDTVNQLRQVAQKEIANALTQVLTKTKAGTGNN